MTSYRNDSEISDDNNFIVEEVQTPSPLISPTDSNNELAVTKTENVDNCTLPQNFEDNGPWEETSSGGISLTELSRFLRDFPTPTEIGQSPVRGNALSRQIRDDRDVRRRLRSSESRLEAAPGERPRNGHRENSSGTEKKSSDARSRRRARISATRSSSRDEGMVLAQRDSTEAGRSGETIAAARKDGMERTETSYAPVTREVTAGNVPTANVSRTDGANGTKMSPCACSSHGNAGRDEETRQGRTIFTASSDDPCVGFCKIDAGRVSPLSFDQTRPRTVRGYRPQTEIILKNLSSDSVSEINELARYDTGRSLTNLELSSPASKLSENVGNAAFVSARSEPTDRLRDSFLFPLLYRNGENTSKEGFGREMFIESSKISSCQRTNERKCVENMNTYESARNKSTNHVDHRSMQRLNIISLLSRRKNNERKEIGANSSRSTASESREIVSVPQTSREVRSKLRESSFMTNRQILKEKSLNNRTGTSPYSNTLSKEDIKFQQECVLDGNTNMSNENLSNTCVNTKEMPNTFIADNDVQEIIYSFQSNHQMKTGESREAINDAEKIPSRHFTTQLNDLELPHVNEKCNNVKLSTKYSAKNAQGMHDNCVNFIGNENLSITSKRSTDTIDIQSSACIYHCADKNKTNSARLYSNHERTFSIIPGVKASTVPNSPSHLQSILSRNMCTCMKDSVPNEISQTGIEFCKCPISEKQILLVDNTIPNIKIRTRVPANDLQQESYRSDNYESYGSEGVDSDISQSSVNKDRCEDFTRSRFFSKERDNVSNNVAVRCKSNETFIIEDLEMNGLQSDVESSKTDDNDRSRHSKVQNFQSPNMKDAKENTNQNNNSDYYKGSYQLYNSFHNEITGHSSSCNNRTKRTSESIGKTKGTTAKLLKHAEQGDVEISPRMKCLSTATICINHGHSISGDERSITYSNEHSTASGNIHQCNDYAHRSSGRDFQFEFNIGDSNVDRFSLKTSNVYDEHNKKILSVNSSKKLKTSSRSVKFYNAFHELSGKKDETCERSSKSDVGSVEDSQPLTDNRQKDTHCKDIKSIPSETTAFFVRRAHEFTVLPPNISSSTSKLAFTKDTRKDSPRVKRKSQDRFPFTISEATSAMSSKFKFDPEYNRANHLSEHSTPREGDYGLDVHPSILRLACKGFQETPYDVLNSVTFDQENEKKKNLVPMMKGFMRKFSGKLRVRSRKSCPATIGETMEVIYKNEKCCADSLRGDTSSNESLGVGQPGLLSPCEKSGDLHWLTSDSTGTESSTASGKFLRKTESCEHIAVNPEELSSPRRSNDAWTRDLTDCATSPRNDLELWSRSRDSSGKSADSRPKRYSVFLATNSRHTQTPECPQANLPGEQGLAEPQKLSIRRDRGSESVGKASLPIDAERTSRQRRNRETYVDDLDRVDAGCFCLRLCNLVARLSTGTLAKDRMLIRQGASTASMINRRRLPLWKRFR